jgi:hypothetical protein
MAKTYIQEINRSTNRTKFMSHNTKPSRNQLNEVINDLFRENRQEIQEWMKYRKFNTKEEMVSYIEMRIKNGVCFGYAMSTLNSVDKYPNLNGYAFRGEE